MKKYLVIPVLFASQAWADQSLFTDSFERANASTPGSNYTVVQGSWGISSDTLVLTSAPGYPNLYVNAASYSNNQYASLTISAWSTGTELGPAVHVQSSGNKFYSVYCSAISGSSCTALTLVAVKSSSSTLTTFTGLSLPAGTTLTLKASGTGPVSLSVWKGSLGSGESQIGATYTDSNSNFEFQNGAAGVAAFNTFSSTNGATYFDSGNVIQSALYTPADSDSATLADSLIAGLVHAVIVSDQASVWDAAAGAHLRPATDADSATITDALIGHIGLRFEAIFDSGAISDRLTTSTGRSGVWPKSAQDGLTITDFTPPFPEWMEFSDSLSAALLRSVNDSTSITDAATVTPLRPRTTFDVTTLADTLNAKATQGRILQESITATDAPSRGLFLSRNLTDPASVQDSAEYNAARAKGLTDSAAIADAPDTTGSHVAHTSDSIFPSDTLGRSLSRTAADAGSFAEAAAAISTHVGSNTDAAAIADLAGASGSHVAQTADGMFFTDTLGRALSRALADSAGLSDRAAAGASHGGTITDAMTLADATGVFKGQILLADSGLISDLPARSILRQAALSEVGTFADSGLLASGHGAMPADAAGLPDVLTASALKHTLALDSLAGVDALSRSAHHAAVLSEAMLLSDFAITTNGRGSFATELTVLRDSVAYRPTYMADGPWGLPDGERITDALRGTRVVGSMVSDALAVVDQPSGTGKHVPAMADVALILDSACVNLLLVNIRLSDAVQPVDHATETSNRVEPLADAIVAADFASGAAGRGVAATDLLAIADLSGASRVVAKAPSDSSAVNDGAITVKLIARAQADSVSIGDSIAARLRPWRKRTVVISN